MRVIAPADSRRRRAVRAALGLVLLLAGCHPMRGCVESRFELAPDSRLPKWFVLPARLQRADVTVTLEYYGPLVGSERTATVTLRTRQGNTLNEVVATLRGPEPLTLEPHAETGPIPYPSYEVLTAKGISDVIEHRRQEPVFYTTDDPEVWRKLDVRDRPPS